MGLILPSIIEAQLLAHAAAAFPYECCGLLLGSGAGDTNKDPNHVEKARYDAADIIQVQPARNIAADRATRFEIDPQVLIDAHRNSRAGGLQVLGYYHSHPAGPPRPSRIDQELAARDGRIWAIVGEGRVELWRDCPAGFVPLRE
ncbi:M67 family metallopeptidase [Croceicoccus sp. F390]|uniref:M67 family metallopeptidase n=1 Tax=Croceicoccus esteveae TaxID=3075597 RepID=A0ABU2ZEB5_9SPHN|nr:M67 family metallopeptidase [Croceicoccus sp. F390]MDT0574624.1 M67 family metallopeptidase [Croceicoccus sp. F390]